jgi:hypothetical protein
MRVPDDIKGVSIATALRANSLRERLNAVMDDAAHYTPQQFADMLHGVAADLAGLAQTIEDAIGNGG